MLMTMITWATAESFVRGTIA